MSFKQWPKRDPIKNYFLVPNEVFDIGLEYGEISVYAYLLRCENRKTYQCHPSYKTIGRAVHMSANTVRKYISGLERKGLVRSEPTMITTKDGRTRNGSLRYTIRPIQEAIDYYEEIQMKRLYAEAARRRAEEALAKYDEKHRNRAV